MRFVLLIAFLGLSVVGLLPAAKAPRPNIVSVLALGTGHFVHAVKKPNIIVIFTDDQGYGDLGCFGATKIKTPNVDRMAAGGKTLTNFCVASPVCSPSRAALLTGRYPKRSGMHQGVLFPKDRKGLHPDEITLAEILKAEGYATACVGK